MDNQQKTSIHPLLAGAGIAVIIFSGVAIAAIMGWIPTSIGTSGQDVTAAKAGQPQATIDKPVAPLAAKPAAAKPRAEPAKVASAPPVSAPAPAKCTNCGVIESVREVEQAGKGTGLGAVGGAVVGGVLGHQVGGGRGKDVMTVVGAVGGAVAGHQIEKKVRTTKVYDITVRLEDGTTRVINEENPPAWKAGDKVKLVNGQIQSNG